MAAEKLLSTPKGLSPMASKIIDTLLSAEAEHLVVKIKGEIAVAKANLVILHAKLEIAKSQALSAKFNL
jgi:hypothetical protein